MLRKIAMLQRLVASLLFAGLFVRCGSAEAAGNKRPAPAQRLVETAQQAVSAYQSGDYATVQKLLAGMADRRALGGLHSREQLLYLLADSEAMLGNETGERRLWQAAVKHFREVELLPEAELSTLARVRVAELLLKLSPDGKADSQASPALRDSLRAAPASIDVPTLHWLLSQVAGRAKKKTEQAEHLRSVFLDHPTHPLATRATEDLSRLEGPALRFSTTERIHRAKNLLAGRKWAEAIAELRALPPDASPAMQDEVEYWLGTSLYRTRHHYIEASEKLLSVAGRLKGERQVEALFHGARALARANKDSEAVAQLSDLVKHHPRSSYAAEASFLTGWLVFNQDKYAEAIPLLQKTVAHHSGTFADEARWYLALALVLTKDDAGAVRELDLLTGKPALLGQKADYWAAQSELRLGQKDRAVARLRKLVEGHPFSFYAQLARLRLQGVGIQVGPFGDTNQSGSADGLRVWDDAVDPSVLRDRRLAPVDELIRLGLKREAAHVLRRLEGELMRDLTPARALPALLMLYGRAGHFSRVHLLGEVHGAQAMRRDPHQVAAAKLAWEAKYPLAYREWIERYSPSGGSPARYLYSIMQKESAYNPYDFSNADALGLLQMIPPTSRRVAKQVGREYTDGILYDPESNIQLGAWYIGRLLKKFKGQIALGAGSFNAGPAAMVRWLGRHGSQPLDVFVELCPYKETREYMKKLLEIYARYVWLYDKQDYLPSLVVDAEYLTGDGIDY